MTSQPVSPVVCAKCEYNLAGLDVSGSCPECGFRNDDSLRLRGLWTEARLRRLKAVTVALFLAALLWTPVWAMVILEITGRPSGLNLGGPGVRPLAMCIALVHAILIGFAAIGGTFASSRQAYHVRLGISIALSSVLLLAALCLSSAIGGARFLQRAFDEWGFATSGLVRAAGITLAVYWILLGIRQTPLAGGFRSRAGAWFLWIYPTVWVFFTLALFLPSSVRRAATTRGDWIVGGVLVFDGVLLLAIAIITVTAIRSRHFQATLAEAAERTPALH